MIALAAWPGGYTLFGDTDSYTELYVTVNEDGDVAENLYWDFEPEEDDTERRVQFRELLSILVGNVQAIDTDTLSGLAFDITDEYDWAGDGSARGLYRLKSEDSANVYAANTSDFSQLIKLMQEYTDGGAGTDS